MNILLGRLCQNTSAGKQAAGDNQICVKKLPVIWFQGIKLVFWGTANGFQSSLFVLQFSLFFKSFLRENVPSRHTDRPFVILIGKLINLRLNYQDYRSVYVWKCMIGNSVKLSLKVVDRSDESLVAWLEAVASSICLLIFQLKQEDGRLSVGAGGCKSAVSWTPVSPHDNMAYTLQGEYRKPPYVEITPSGES